MHSLKSIYYHVGPIADLCQGFVRSIHALRQDWRFHTGYGLLQIITNSIFVQNLIVFLPFYFLRYFSIYLYCSCVHLTEKNIFPLIILWAEKISFSYLNFILLNGIIPFPFSFPQKSLYCNSLLLILISPQVFLLLYSYTTIFNQPC